MDTLSQTFAAVIVTFNPDKETIDYLKRISELCTLLVVVDNSTKQRNFSQLDQDKKVRIVKNENNLGLATALNQGVMTAGKAGFYNIFLFDQDTRVENNYFQEMLSFKNSLNKNNIVIVAPDFVDVNLGTHARFAKLNKWTWKNLTCEESSTTQPLYVNFAITSGSLIDFEKYLKIGPFREDFFIDHIDSEYCIRASHLGYKIAINCSVCINHKIGNRTQHKLLGLTIKPNNHSALRRYYISRNGMYICVKYGIKCPAIVSLNLARLGHEFLSIIFFEQHKASKLRSLFIGSIHGLFGHMKQM